MEWEGGSDEKEWFRLRGQSEDLEATKEGCRWDQELSATQIGVQSLQGFWDVQGGFE
jgi:hypothetical protein